MAEASAIQAAVAGATKEVLGGAEGDHRGRRARLRTVNCMHLQPLAIGSIHRPRQASQQPSAAAAVESSLQERHRLRHQRGSLSLWAQLFDGWVLYTGGFAYPSSQPNRGLTCRSARRNRS